MRDLIRPDASFTPRELFARMQGAWFEPRQGSMWQENTGVTPTTSGGQTIGKLVDLSAGRVASQATAANRPLFGARRNLLTYTEDFSNAVWLATGGATLGSKTLSVTGPTGIVDAWKIVFSGGPVTKGFGYSLGGSWPADTIASTSVWLKLPSGSSTVSLNGQGSDPIGAKQCNLTAEWQQFTLNGQVVGGKLKYFLIFNIGVSELHIYHPQLELGSVATDYQRITTATDYDAGRFPAIRHADSTDVLTATLPDLGGGVFSAAGSVYFATPQGMSALHNQSIGTTYNLPALQTDIYGTVITPARLAPPLEQRLALYMHRLAGLSDADFFWQEQATDGMTGQLLADDNDTILLRA